MGIGIRRPKVLLLVTLSDWGGAPRVVYELAAHLSGEYEVSVACAPGGILVRRLAQSGVRVIPIQELCRTPHPWRDLKAFLRLVRVMRRERFEIVHAHSTKAGMLGRMAARLAGVPVAIFTAHSWPFAEGRPWWGRLPLILAERFAGRLSTKIVCVSNHGGREAERHQIAPAGRLVVIRNGMDPGPFGRADGSVLRDALAPYPRPVITFVGRLAVPKDLPCLIAAMQEVAGGTLLIVGEGPLRRRIEREVRLRALERRVLLMDPRPDIPNVLAASDIFVLPSRWEGLPLVIIEAMMAGLPVVATGVGGVPELVEDGVTGVLVPPGDPKALACALSRLLADPRLRERMGTAGREKALREFRLDRMLRETSRLYKELRPLTGSQSAEALLLGSLSRG